MEKLSLATLDQCRFMAQADEALLKIMEDVFLRPGLDAPREVKMTVEIIPEDMDVKGNLISVSIRHTVKTSLPGQKSKSIGIVDGRDIMVSVHQPDARQMDMAYLDEERRKREAQ